MHRFFRSTVATYEAVRLQLDDAWGHPSPGAETCISPASEAPKDRHGRVVLAVDEAFCAYPDVAAVLPSLLAGGAVEEIDEATYRLANDVHGIP